MGDRRECDPWSYVWEGFVDLRQSPALSWGATFSWLERAVGHSEQTDVHVQEQAGG